MPTTQQSWLRCPKCDCVNKSQSKNCWLCRAELESAKAAHGSQPPDFSPPMTFGLSTIFLVITLIAVCLGVTVQAPGLGILIFVLATPALVRTIVYGHGIKGSGFKLTAQEKIEAFIASLGVVTLIVIAAVGAFMVVCYPVGLLGSLIAMGNSNGALGGTLFYSGWVLGILAGITVAVLMIRLLWKPKG